jgi:hypothetical protein
MPPPWKGGPKGSGGAWGPWQGTKRAASTTKSPCGSKKAKNKQTQEAAQALIPPDDLMALTASATTALLNAHNEGKPYVEGSSLSKLLQTEQPEVVARAKTALGGKGWLRAVVDIMDEVTQVLVEGKGEPCYCMAQMAPASGKMEAIQSEKVARDDPSVSDVDPQHASILLNTMMSALQDESKGYMSGNELRKLLDEQQPDIVKEVKTLLKGKGWLRKILESDGGIYTVEVKTVGEPCYTLDANFSGGKMLGPVGQVPPQLKIGGLAHLDETEKTTLQAAAVSAIQVAEGGYLPGNKLQKIMAEAHPSHVSTVKSKLGGKGWLRKLLCDQDDMEVTVTEVSVPAPMPGHGEPCYAFKDSWVPKEATLTGGKPPRPG